MLVNELKALTAAQIREIGLPVLYKSKKLSNVNIDCFVDGFTTAVNKADGIDAKQAISRLLDAVKERLDDINMYCAYGQRCMTADESNQFNAGKEIIESCKILLNNLDVKNYII